MKKSIFTPSSEVNLREPLINEKQRRFITSVSRALAYQLEQQGRFPKRIQIDKHTNVWKLTEILAWVRSRPVAELTARDIKHATI